MVGQVAERTAADKKGGHLARRLADGRLMLRESAMCPDDDKATFEDISKHKFFNTNNLWVNLPKLKVRAALWLSPSLCLCCLTPLKVGQCRNHLLRETVGHSVVLQDISSGLSTGDIFGMRPCQPAVKSVSL